MITSRYGDRVTTSKLYLSDGGDGFLASLKEPLELEIVSANVTGLWTENCLCPSTACTSFLWVEINNTYRLAMYIIHLIIDLFTTKKGPLCTPLEAKYGVNLTKKLAVIEMATASGKNTSVLSTILY